MKVWTHKLFWGYPGEGVGKQLRDFLNENNIEHCIVVQMGDNSLEIVYQVEEEEEEEEEEI